MQGTKQAEMTTPRPPLTCSMAVKECANANATFSNPRPSGSPPPHPEDSHAVEELSVRLVPFALRHQAVQLVDQLGLHLRVGEGVSAKATASI